MVLYKVALELEAIGEAIIIMPFVLFYVVTIYLCIGQCQCQGKNRLAS